MMKFFKTRKSEQVDPRGGFVMYPEFCIDTNPKFAHNLTVQEVMILEQDAEIAALCARVERLEVVYKKHTESAERCNFVLCGCDWCEAYRAVLSESAASVHGGEKE